MVTLVGRLGWRGQCGEGVAAGWSGGANVGRGLLQAEVEGSVWGGGGYRLGWRGQCGERVAASWHSPVTVFSVVWVLLGTSFLLGATLICSYCRCQPCKPVVPGKSIHVLHTYVTRDMG